MAAEGRIRAGQPYVGAASAAGSGDGGPSSGADAEDRRLRGEERLITGATGTGGQKAAQAKTQSVDSPRPKREARPQAALAKALTHPLRAHLLTILAERTASPKEIADELQEALPNVSYHVRVLEDLGLVELIEEEAIRGAVAHFYRAVEQEVPGNPAWKWTPLLLDEGGWQRVIEIQASAVEAILREQASAGRRLEKKRGNGIKAILGVLLFETAAPDSK